MTLEPSFDTFRTEFEAGHNQVVWTRLAADLDTPVSVMLKLAGAGRNSFILESVTGGELRGRYSIIGMNPDLIWECQGTGSRVNRSARFDDDAWETCADEPLTALRGLLHESRIDLPEGLPAASAGLFGYLGYDMARLVEPLGPAKPDPIGTPDAVLLRPTIVAVLDGVKGDVILVAPAWAGSGLSAKAAWAQAAERVTDARAALERGLPRAARDLGPAQAPGEAVSNFTREGFKAAVERARQSVISGETLQIVPAQRWALDFHEPPFALYRSLRRTNPSPFMFHFNFGSFHVVGASPEICVRLTGGEMTIRPIAGTRRRGATPAEDRALEAELLADPKDHEEHEMLIDLGLEDISKAAAPGTARATETFVVERYSHVMHIVSNVTGTLAPGKDALDALMAGMPAGTVSGAPKLRALEIIDELEPEKRGIYGGACGYFGAGGDMDMCIALRTGVVKDGKLYIQAGAGIVEGSVPESEYMETVHKSAALRRAAEDAARFRDGGR
ncbi:MAG: anthranilate synthase component I [Rubellimicrobium sp.]|nr:anthranilate synthase component I [Rubellimicrobium sp.]